MNPRNALVSILSACLLAAASASLATPAKHSALDAGLNKQTTERTERLPCIDDLFEFFPGYTAYCHGMNKWHAGRYQQGLDDLKRSAGWASKNAQYALGLIYFNGHHVPTDRARGLAWLLLSAERQTPRLFKNVAAVAFKVASPQQRAQAMKLYRQLLPRYGDAFAAHRARMRYTHAMQRAIGSWAGDAGTRVCIAGLTPMGVAAHPPQSGGDGVPGTEGSCPPTLIVKAKLQKASDRYFKGLLPEGHVDVGPLKQVHGPKHISH
ncbi:sel1 repeat family protein [Oleiagrimonas sp. MCCC 1A03011]|uniref:sel1 repeat family protein n=1 Tax=Oleiagrimonas sp. MCCC 1A03011 TaxID=1926883 RepID=UPI0011BF14CD|nr:sel1 repeat family protein [Oleiagrimonas sp. MCCC 1A03011]